jgi:hypothetical protein
MSKFFLCLLAALSLGSMAVISEAAESQPSSSSSAQFTLFTPPAGYFIARSILCRGDKEVQSVAAQGRKQGYSIAYDSAGANLVYVYWLRRQ